MNNMLGRTASGLFWMMRYLERMENTARLVDAGFRLSLTTARSTVSEWESVLSTAGARGTYFEKYDMVEAGKVADFLIADKDNLSSVNTSIKATRENARMTRTALTREVWEVINESWMLLDEAITGGLTHEDLPELLALIRQRAALVRGTIHSTMLRNDIFCFVTLGTMVERADNTARILDTKYYVLLPKGTLVGSALDRVQWEMILRSASAERSFHWLHGGHITSAAIVDFLIHDKRLPRSVAYCFKVILDNMRLLEADYGWRAPAHDLADALNQHISTSTHETIIGSGLHEFLAELIERNAALSKQIENDYRFEA